MGNRYVFKHTFEEWCINNNRKDILDLWDYDKNEVLPSQVPCGTKKKYYFKCPSGIHESEAKRILNVTNKPTHQLMCLQCSNGRSGYIRENLKGQTFGELIVVEWDADRSSKTKNSYWFCLCSCGRTVSVHAAKLKSGDKTKCGGKISHLSGLENPKPDKINFLIAGVTDVYDPQYLKELRRSSEYYYYRKSVMQKDDYKCIVCGTNMNLEVHHIYPFATYPSDRFNVNTGVCLCKRHHSVSEPYSFHSIYGRYDNTPEQLEQYVNTMRQMLGNYKSFDVYKYMNPLDADDMELDDSMFDCEL